MEKTVDPAHEIGENVTITDRSQLLSITTEQAKKIKSLRIENQLIDDEISIRPKIFAGNPGQVYFVNCSFLGDGMGILRECPSVSKVGFIRCNLSYDILKRLLYSNDPYNEIGVLDLTGNNLAKDPKRFVDVLRSTIVPFKSIGELILVDNGFDSTIISMIKKVSGSKIEKIYL
jgi:hypothetical protein